MYEFQTTRNYRNELNCDTRIPLGFDRRELHINTSKSSRGGISCDASVVQVADDGRGFTHAFGMCGRGGDYRKTIASDRTARCTVKSAEAMQRAALEAIAPILDEARAHYVTAAA